MSFPMLSSYKLTRLAQPAAHITRRDQQTVRPLSTSALAASITREASAQTYFTIRYLVDRPLVADAYRAYAYFRWVDDMVDQEQLTKVERLAFLGRQQAIITRCYQGEWPTGLCPAEYLVADLIHGAPTANHGLQTYIEQMMAVMAFDAERKGRLIAPEELAAYTRCLATAVTEALHYFIGHNQAAPQDDTRYVAVTGAHITHMLRDAMEDTAVGYYNVPQDFLASQGISPVEVNHEAYRTWVQERVQLARRCFATSRAYLARVENRRCRLAGYAYIARFEVVLDAIEKDGYSLRPVYPERKSKRAGLKMGLTALGQIIRPSLPARRTPMINATPFTEVAG